jgi:antibiotic biosynthesis monooxygenase (ABM) superfamily enzyme
MADRPAPQGTAQLRVYQLSTDPDEQEAWLDWWRNGARVVREHFGFQVRSAVLNPETGVFTWVVVHSGDFAAAEAEMLASPERKEAFARSRPEASLIETPMVRPIV